MIKSVDTSRVRDISGFRNMPELVRMAVKNPEEMITSARIRALCALNPEAAIEMGLAEAVAEHNPQWLAIRHPGLLFEHNKALSLALSADWNRWHNPGVEA